jgi:hypothetical protein
MFIQVFQGPVADGSDARVMMEDWLAHLAPGAQGWLGSTTGVTDDGMLVGIARFESREAARRNSERPEQGEWWERCSKLFTGDVTFRDCSKVTTSRRGGSDDAGFVQVIQGHSPDPARLDELAREFDERAGGLRPELYGFLLAWDDSVGGGFTEVAYFSSEEAARHGEQQEPPADLRPMLEEEASLLQDVTYFDLRRVWLDGPR